MVKFCNGPLWIKELFWGQQIPYLTECFQTTVLSLLPCVFLIIFVTPEIYRIKHFPNKKTPWTLLNLSKIFFSFALASLSLIQLLIRTLTEKNYENVFTAQLLSSMIEAICFVIVMMLTLYQKKKNVHTSGLIFLFWLLFFICDATSFVLSFSLSMIDEVNFSIIDPIDEFSFVCKTAHTAFVTSSFFLSFFADYKVDFNEKKSCPINKSSFASSLSFWWFNALIWKGMKKPLEQNDLWELDSDFKTKSAYKKFNKYWSETCKKYKIDKTKEKLEKDKDKFFEKEIRFKSNNNSTTKLVKDINFVYPLLRTYKNEFLICSLYKLVGCLMTFSNPIVLDYLLTYIKTNDPIIWKGYMLALSMFVFSAFESILNNKYEYLISLIVMKVRSALTLTIYKKSLKLSAEGRKNYTTGEIVNIMSVDCQKVVEYVAQVNIIWSSTLQIIVSIYFLWQQLGLATLAGVGVMVIIMPMNVYITKKLKDSQTTVMKNKDSRIKTLNESLNGIKVLKLYAWENAFIKKILDFRTNEVLSLRTIIICFSIIVFVFNSAPFLVSVTSFATYVLTNSENILDANKAFVSLSLFNIIRVPLGLVPFIISSGSIAYVSALRINKFLSGHELENKGINKSKDKFNPIKFKNAYFSWNDESEENVVLKNINLKVKKEKLIAIVGSIGSGKSSLLSALLGELQLLQGEVEHCGSFAYIPQQAWIQNTTLKNNIVFSEKFNKKKYEEILEKSQLLPDLKILSAGDETEIGEKGINLSGGQKQRVSIARAVYLDRDIYLFDDPLSALDSNVGKEVFDKIISNKGLLKNKTRLLVTHRLSLLKKVDHIVVMKDGTISEQGTYSELMEKKGHFSELIIQFLSETFNNELEAEEDLELLKEIKEIQLQKSQKEKLELISSKSMESSKLVSSNYLSNSRKFEKSSSNFSKQSLQLEKDKKIESSQAEELKKKSEFKGKLVQKEHVEVGSVKLKVYWDYIKALRLSLCLLTIGCYAISHTWNIFYSLWLSDWSNDSLDPANYNNTSLRNKRLIGYATYGVLEMIFVFIATITLSLACLNAAKKIHKKMVTKTFLAPMEFFDTTPLGRILNRFTKDIDTADFGININVRGVIVYNFRAFVSFTLIAIETPWFLAALVPIIAMYYIIQKFYISTSRQLKRLESTTKSPVYSHFQETINGGSSIRAFGCESRFIEEACNKIDLNHTCSYPNIVSARWLTIRLEFLGYVIVFLAALFAIIFKNTLSPGLIGVSVSSALTITATLNMLIRSFADLETNIVSIERCLEYCHIKPEAPQEIPENKPSLDWPDKGVIKFEDNFSTKYRSDLDLVLDSINLQFSKGEKVGVVGRTGAGKSSLTLALFRIIESVNGKIKIDGIDISKIGLYDLRSRLTIIPQDPVLFTGTLRLNLDPFEKYSDKDLWDALELSHLKDFVSSLDLGLDHKIAEGGENLSIGQKQLVCLARALLRKTKILVLDEATAAVDLETDELIQETIRKEFYDCTIVTIAHRLNTIMDYDKVLVLEKGNVAEFDSPKKLLSDENTIFYSLAKNSGIV